MSVAALHAAHEDCASRFVEALWRGDRLILLDNTNAKRLVNKSRGRKYVSHPCMRRWQYRRYLQVAEAVGCRVLVLELSCARGEVDVKAFSRR